MHDRRSNKSIPIFFGHKRETDGVTSLTHKEIGLVLLFFTIVFILGFPN